MFLRLPEVQARTGLKRTTIYERVRNGDFPRPIKLSTRASAWISSEVDRWAEKRIAESRGEPNGKAAA
jgi:prophage regulatory protein